MKGNGMKSIPMTGRRFGRLTVLERVDRSGKELRWLCLCDCGTSRVAFGTNLRRGLTRSCGCLRAEITSAKFTASLLGRSYGELTPTSRARDYVAPNGARHVRWNCSCTCGRTTVASANDLRSGHTTTCGCRRYERLLDLEHVLYRAFDVFGVLLYIGITNEWDRRRGEHARTKSWWTATKKITQESFPDRERVLAAEKQAIRSESPRFNVERYLGGDAK